MKHESADRAECEEQAALYLAGTFSDFEVRAFEAHAAGCSICAQELQSLQPVVWGLVASVAKAPPPQLREQLLERISQNPRGPQVWRRWAPDAGNQSLRILRAAEGTWEETPVPGVSVRRLSVDLDRKSATMLVRMSAGASYPSHRHAAAEECLVLEGDLVVGDDVLHSGDFQRAEAGSVHPRQFTRNGCLLYILSSLEDELLEA
jgi:anti-sigma factor ChrR (cupin superfamily)